MQMRSASTNRLCRVAIVAAPNIDPTPRSLWLVFGEQEHGVQKRTTLLQVPEIGAEASDACPDSVYQVDVPCGKRKCDGGADIRMILHEPAA